MTSSRVADRYALDREIGRGASGAVWLGHDEVLGRPVALKRVGPPPGADRAEVMRAEREARLAAQVNHPHVISVFDFVETGDEYWLVMEYVEGATLSALIRERGPLPPDTAARMLAQVADALAAAHELGIVHRDVKPSNILVRGDGEVKLSDFGIARGAQDATLTQTGIVTGSPAYLSPEVATGGTATPASDVWSFGATLYHALAGQPPYHVEGQDNAVLAVLYRIVHEEPPRLRTAGWLAPLLEATMTREPADRPAMSDVRDYLVARAGAPVPAADRTAVLPATAPQPEAVAVPPPATAAPTATQHLAEHPAPPAPPVPPASSYEPDDHRDDRRPDVRRIALVGVAAVAVLAMLGLALLQLGDGDDPRPAAGGDPTSRATGGETRQPTDGATTEDAGRPTARELEAFATDYVQTASSDPAAGFQRLTASYQDRSPDYEEFWGQMNNPQILDISADPAAMTVTYTYRYEFPGRGNVTETVTLELVEEQGELRIANGYSS